MPPASQRAAGVRRRVARIIIASLPVFLIGGLLVAPGLASAGEIFFAPDLAVSMTDSPDPVDAGGTVTYTMTVSNTGSEDAFDAVLDFSTDGVGIESAAVTGGDGGECDTEGATDVTCDLGTIPTDQGSAEFELQLLAFNEAEVVIEVEAPNNPGGEFLSNASVFAVEQGEENPSDNEDSELTNISEGEGGGDSDSGPLPPGGELSTVPGGNANPVNPQDPFAISLQNVSDQTFTGFIEEVPCDGSQTGDPLCSEPRIGGSAGDFQFEPSGGPTLAAASTTTGGSLADPILIAKLYYDKTLVEGVRGFKILYQKDENSPVLRLARCKAGVRTSECFKSNKKRRSGDQIVRVFLSEDPRVTRG
jgi:hypothetical protein